ncbi:helix-turn-helix domain-containing protein [Deinococcus phoenicis]|uniref:hypothetical protein n=1 Tax=Deinococcus phoenicis TaxID=1476583 RepID=UPI00137690D2|nr:hypothetical protein [Deinococcus phoenicis]
MTRPGGIFTARTPEQARLLLDFAYQRVLGPTMQGEASAGEVARDAELTVKQAHHRLTRLCAAGLVAVTGERKRGGRPVKLYRAAAPAYRVPFELTEADDLRDLLAALHRPFLEAYLSQMAANCRQQAHEVLLVMNSQGQLQVNYGGPRPGNEPSRGFGTIGEVRLSPITRAELERRLRDLKDWSLAREQEERQSEDAEDCLLGLMFTPGRLPER